MSVRVRWSLCGLLAGSGGCEQVGAVLEDKAQQVAQDMTPSESEQAPVGRELSADEQLERKLILYLECQDRASARIRDSWARYDERLKDDGTPRKKGTKPYLYKIDSELTPCADAARKGPHTEPGLPDIEQAMADYLEHAQAFAVLSVELDTYYEQQAYTEDGWAKGKELAPGFKAAFEGWSEAEARLRTLVSTRKETLDRALLARVEQREGQSMQWHARALVLAAQALTRCAVAPKATADDCQPAYDAMRDAQAGFTKSVEADDEAARAVFWMTSFRSSSERYVAQADETMPLLRKGKANPESNGKLDQALTALTSDAKNLRFE